MLSEISRAVEQIRVRTEGKTDVLLPRDRNAIYTGSPMREMWERGEGRETGEFMAICPMWNWERVEGTGRIANVYYVAQEAGSMLRVG